MESIEIRGRKIAFSTSGERAPGVILETGLGAESDEWAYVQAQVASFARVLRYDRVGRGASDPPTRPRDAMEMVDELNLLVRAVGMPLPFVLVGHSFGGLLARLYTHRYPSDVCGLVLVDAMHEDQFDVIGPRFPPDAPSDPEPLRAMRRFWSGGWRDPAATSERIDFVSSFRQMREIRPFADVRIHVMTAGNHSLVAAEYREAFRDIWNGLQAQFLKLSPRATQTYLPECGHFIQREQPDAIVAAIRELTVGLE